MKILTVINKIWSLSAILFIILYILDLMNKINIDNNMMKKFYYGLLILYGISLLLKNCSKSQSSLEEVEKIHIFSVNQNLLTYKYMLIRIILVLILNVFCMLQYFSKERNDLWFNNELNLMNTTIFVVSFYCIVISICEVFYIVENKRLLKLQNTSISEVDSKSIMEKEFIENINTDENSYYIIKNRKSLYKIGTNSFSTSNNRGRYFYIEEKNDDCFKQIKFASLDEFVQEIRVLNDNREIFDVVSKNKVINPKKCKKQQNGQ